MYSLLHHNTFGIDAGCRDFKDYKNEEELRGLLPQLKGERWLHIGSGSNLLFVRDFSGIILHSSIKGIKEVRRDGNYVRVQAGAGEVWDDFVAVCTERGWYGLENLSYIPGEVGACAVQNIGAYGAEAGQFIEEVETICVETGEKRVFCRDECRYAYRSSVFKKDLKGQYVVTYVTFRLKLKFSPDVEYGAIQRELVARGIVSSTLTAQTLRKIIIEIRKAKLPDPAVTGSAGSFFMNPVVSQHKFEELLKIYPDMPHYPVEDGVKIPAGWMIEQCGWKGRSLGAAGVYARQALVIVNLGGATGGDIVRLSDAVRKDVKERFGIEIFPEVNFID